MVPVNKDRVALWAEALENPKLVQGQNRLAYRDLDGPWKQCCLDVACQVALANGLEGVEAEEVQLGTISTMREYVWEEGDAHYRESLVLPAPVCAWYGFEDTNPDIGSHEASYFNDTLRLTFSEIAAKVRDAYLDEGENHE
jgi:hypothetical protein